MNPVEIEMNQMCIRDRDICEYCSVDLVYDPVEIMDQVIEEVVSQLQEFHVTYQKMNQSERG